MSQLNRYRELEAQLAAQLQQLEEMKNSDSLKKEIEFEDKLKTLMADYGVNLRDVINLLDLQAGRPSFTTQAPEKGSRALRAVKRYHNPHSGEVVETKGGNHKTLKAWKAQYGSDTVKAGCSKSNGWSSEPGAPHGHGQEGSGIERREL